MFRNKLASIGLIAIITGISCPSAGAQYLDPIGDGLKYGCGVAEQAKKVFSVAKSGARTELTKKQISKLIAANEAGNKVRRKLANDLKKCLKGKLPSTNACDVLAENARGTTNALVVQGRLCSVDKSPVVLVELYAGDQLIQRCSGVMISQQVLLTAAHCMYTGPDGLVVADRASIQVGEAEYTTPYVGFADAARKPKPQFEYYDIGYAVFDDPVPGVQPVGVVSRNSPIKSGERVVLAGFGADEMRATGELIAGYTRLDQVGEALMTTRFRGLPGESSSCSGDSGGAVLVNRQGRWVLAGIISYGPLDCGPVPVTDPVKRYGHTNLYHEPLYNFLADSTCTSLVQETGCPLPLSGS